MNGTIVVDEIWRFPVKSMGGERLEAAEVDERGLVGDRSLAVYTADGKIASGKTTRRFTRVDGLLQYRARTERDGTVTVTTPAGRQLLAGTPEADRQLSQELGRSVAIRRESNVRHHDDGALHAVTGSDVDDLARRCGVDLVDVRRFRPNLVLSMGESGGAVVPLDDVWSTPDGLELQPTGPAERCPMVAHPLADLSADRRPLRIIASAMSNRFGIYLRVLAPGRLSVGSALTPGPLPRERPVVTRFDQAERRG